MAARFSACAASSTARSTSDDNLDTHLGFRCSKTLVSLRNCIAVEGEETNPGCMARCFETFPSTKMNVRVELAERLTCECKPSTARFLHLTVFCKSRLLEDFSNLSTPLFTQGNIKTAYVGAEGLYFHMDIPFMFCSCFVNRIKYSYLNNNSQPHFQPC